MKQVRKNLVVLRAGDGSLHRRWLDGLKADERDFDLFISYYGKGEGTHRDDGEYWEHRPGPKWSCVAELLASNPQLIEQYQGFWFPDDDLDATAPMLNRMFNLFHGMELKLAQPALTLDSYYSWPQLLQRQDSVLRQVAFVEVMAPIFNRDSLKQCLASFSESRSGWGLDWVWPKLLGGAQDGRIAIIDATPVKHTRPVGGELYKNNPELDPRNDSRRLAERYGVQLDRFTSKFACFGLLTWRLLPWHERVIGSLKALNAKRLAARRMRQQR